MPSLAEDQSRFITCLQKGPNFFPEEMFTEDRARALLGLKAHANTISHARLVALENAYPKLDVHLGHEEFHAVSRKYVEQDHILTCDMNNIAAGFADFLEREKYENTAIDLARVEWAWIESYHAAEAEPLALTDIAVLDEENLLGFAVNAHPAMRLIDLTGPLSLQLSELGEETPHALMVARPEAQVLFHPLEETDHAIARKIAKITNMGNLLEVAIEQGDETTAMERIIRLIGAGALTTGKGKK